MCKTSSGGIDDREVLLVVGGHAFKTSCGLGLFELGFLKGPFFYRLLFLFGGESFPEFWPYGWRTVGLLNFGGTTTYPFPSFW